ncbi:hypothetical protein F442_12694, partial [Phytophthora nicotianae P10297]
VELLDIAGRGWRKELSDASLSFVREPQLEEGRFRKSGAGPNHKLKSYESQVLEYFDSCMADGAALFTEATLG